MEIKDQIDNIANSVEDFKGNIDSKIENSTKPIADKAEALEAQITDLTEKVTHASSVTDSLKDQLRASQSEVKNKDEKFVYKAMGHYVMGTFGKNEKSKQWLNDHGVMNTMKEATTAAGGAVVPEVFVPTLIDLLETYGTARSAATVVPMTSDTAYWPQITSDVTVYKVGEAGSITPSDPAFSTVELVAQKLAALTAVSSELLEDAALSVGMLVAQSMARALAKAEDQAFWLGDGSSTYYGYTGITGAFTGLTDYETGTAGLHLATNNLFSELTIGEIRGVAENLPAQYEGSAKWYCSKAFYFQVLVRLAQAAGGAYMAEYNTLPGGNFMGYPVEIINVMPTADANSSIPLIFGDIGAGSFFGDRRSMNIQQDNSPYFTSDQTAIRMTERFAINVFGQGAASTSGAAGPICGLVMAAS